jgi:CDP-glucose 4,6-dehydratase
LHGYLLLARELWMRPSLAGAFNFGPDPQEAATVREVIALAQRAYGHGEVSWIENDAGPHEAGLLALDPTKAKACLGMRSRWNLAQSVQRTVHWYREQLAGADARALCERDIAAYMAQPARNARPQAAAPSLIALAG